MGLTFIVILLLVASASAAAHHKEGHAGGEPKADSGESGAVKQKVKTAGNSNPAPAGGHGNGNAGGNGNGNANGNPASSAAPTPQIEVERPVEQAPEPEPEPRLEPVHEPAPVTPTGSSRPDAEVESVDGNPGDAPRPDPVDETATAVDRDVHPPGDVSGDDVVDDVVDSGATVPSRLEDPVPETRGSLMDAEEDVGAPQEPATTTHDDAPRATGGGGGIRLDVDVKDKVATSSPGLPLIGITYWVDDHVIHLLADPVPEDDDLSGLPQYEWLWPDGTTTVGGAFQTHRITNGLEQYIVSVVRLDEDGIATHENTEWIDLTFYNLSAGPAASQYGPTQVHALGEAVHPATPKKNSDIGAAIESVPAPPLVPVIGLLGMVAWWRRRG